MGSQKKLPDTPALYNQLIHLMYGAPTPSQALAPVGSHPPRVQPSLWVTGPPTRSAPSQAPAALK